MIGCDIVNIDRIKDPYKIARRILSEQEYEQFSNYSSNRQKEFLAGRFAAREAIIKALPIPLKLKEIVVEPPKEIQYQGIRFKYRLPMMEDLPCDSPGSKKGIS